MTLSVKRDHPIFEWDAGNPALTVNTELSRNTPLWAHNSRLPVFGNGILKSSLSSLKIFCSEGGFLTQFFTELPPVLKMINHEPVPFRDMGPAPILPP